MKVLSRCATLLAVFLRAHSFAPVPSISSVTRWRCDNKNLGTGDVAGSNNNIVRLHLQRQSSCHENVTPPPSTTTSFEKSVIFRASKMLASFGLAMAICSCTLTFGGTIGGNGVLPAMADDTVVLNKNYDGFAEYAKENQMEQSDVGCFVSKCGDQTKALFSNPRGIKGVSCLGRCKAEQACATRCFAEFGSESLDDWLSCTIEENECVKVPKNIDNSAEDVGYPYVLQNFDPSTLVGTWYKTDGLNPNYDLFDCQTNKFTLSDDGTTSGQKELDMDIFLRIQRPEGGYWENALTEHMVVDATTSPSSNLQLVPAASAASLPTAERTSTSTSPARTMHTEGKMYGLKFSENWYILGESNGSSGIPPFKLVAYKGHTLQGNYEGAFVYAKEPILPEAAIPAVKEAAARGGLDFDQFTRIDNTCPAGYALNNEAAGTGTSTTDWIDLVIGEGGVIDWISPGWRGEYKR
ncbi:hypothetical protein ACA910_007814 [Epithemia clementina (nom. ined.)]